MICSGGIGEFGGSGQPAHILIADDNADMREYLRLLLCADAGVSNGAHGEAALEAARARRPDLILTRRHDAGADGSACRAVRADPALKTIPIIMLSARSGEESRAMGIEAGADDYLVKPFSARELVARVQTHVKLAQAQAALSSLARLDEHLSSGTLRRFTDPNAGAPLRIREDDAYSHGRTRLMAWPSTRHFSICPLPSARPFAGDTMRSSRVTRRSSCPICLSSSPGGGIRYYSGALRPWLAPDGTRAGLIAVSIETTEQAGGAAARRKDEAGDPVVRGGRS